MASNKVNGTCIIQFRLCSVLSSGKIKYSWKARHTFKAKAETLVFISAFACFWVLSHQVAILAPAKDGSLLDPRAVWVMEWMCWSKRVCIHEWRLRAVDLG